MATSIQPPDPLRFKWERYTMVIRPSTFPRRSGGVLGRASDSHVQSTHRNDGMSGDEAIASAFHMFWETVAAAAQDPVPPVSALLSNNREQVGHYGSFDFSCDVWSNTGCIVSCGCYGDIFWLVRLSSANGDEGCTFRCSRRTPATASLFLGLR